MPPESEQYDEWTPCQMYGHVFETDEDWPERRYCAFCGDSYIEDTETGRP